MKVLVAYGSKRGGTAGLAQMIGDELRLAGFDPAVLRAGDVKHVGEYDAVVIAGALYSMRWHRDARRFARRFDRELRDRPVWLVSSGPLDTSATTKEIPPVKQVRTVMEAIGARGHATFGGRLESTASGFPASAMARTRAGDWRDPDHIHRWVLEVAQELGHVGSAA
jgi:menaquinone-dependent protoporphyrinogen oxidase